MEPNKWNNSLIWCPSQCYMYRQVNGTDYILYLRWRWNDPWRARIITNAWDEESMSYDTAEWSEDLFAERDLWFADENYEPAQKELESIFLELVSGV